MANVLGTLFSEIATAIREKTGDTATMKPAEFPDKISGIETGGGGNIAEVYLSSSLALTTAVNTKIPVNFGFEPDVIVLIANRDTTISTDNFAYFGLSARYKEASGKSITNVAFYIYSNKMYTQTYSLGIDSTNDSLPIHSADSTGFKLGKKPIAGNYYLFAAKLC